MPFTFSHPAAVLPLLRTPLPASALVIGSMVPDLPLYAPTFARYEVTHTVVGTLGVDALMAFAVFALWHGFLSRPALAASPPALRQRVAARAVLGLRRRLGSPRAALVVYLSFVVGSLTHVLWDEFTHIGRWGTDNIAWLLADHGILPGYKWAQFVSGAVGGLVLLLWFAGWWRSSAHPPATSIDPAGSGLPRALSPTTAVTGWAVLVGGGATGALAGVVTVLLAGPDVEEAAFRAATWGILATGITAAALAATWHRHDARTPSRSGSTES